MAFLAEFEYDGFVSYAHSQYDCWAQAFVAELEQLVAGGLNTVASSDGTSGEDKLKFWMDPETEGNRPLSDNLKSKVERSGCIIVLLTPRFLKSDWCNRELDWFEKTIRSKAQDQSLPLFMVRLANTERSEWPACLRDLPGYDFVGDPKLNTPVGYQGAGQPPQGQEYWKALRDLAREIVEHLKARRQAPTAANKPKGDTNLQIVHTPPQSRLDRPAIGKPRLYLAAVPEDCIKLRRQAAQLLGEHFEIVPAENPRDVKVIRDQAADWARTCSSSVMLLGASSGIWPEDEAGFVVYQHQQIVAAGRPVHCYPASTMPPLEEMDSGPYRDMLGALNIGAPTALEAFVERVCATIAPAAIQPKSVYLVTDGDRKLESEVRRLLDRFGAMVFPLPYTRAEARDLSFINREDVVKQFIQLSNAILLLHGEGKRTRPEWVHFTAHQLKYRYADVRGGKQFAIVDAPPEPRLATEGAGLPVLAGDCPEFAQQMLGWLQSIPSVPLAA